MYVDYFCKLNFSREKYLDWFDAFLHKNAQLQFDPNYFQKIDKIRPIFGKNVITIISTTMPHQNRKKIRNFRQF